MRGQLPNVRDRVLAELADRQHGVVTRGQLLDAGLGARVVEGAVRSGRLRPVFRGVYAVGHTALRREGWWMAALLVGGDGAALSHRTAGILWGLVQGPEVPVDVIVARDAGRRPGRIHARRMRLSPDETMVRDGLRTTTPARTLVDLAGILEPRALRDAVERAQDTRRFAAGEIRAVLDRRPNRTGTRALRELVELLHPDADNARSFLERRFLALVRRARLPRPTVNEAIAGRARDFVWRERRLVVEVDGYRYHSSRAAQARDRRRDRELTALGWRPARFTYEDVAFEPDRVRAELSRLLDSGEGGIRTLERA